MTQKLWTQNFLILLIGNLLVSVAFYFLITALPLYLVDDLRFTKSDAGIILSMYIFTAVLIRPFAGPMLDAFGRRWIYIGSLFFFAALFSFYPYISTYTGFVAIRIMHGITWGILTTAGNTIVMDILPIEKKGEGVGYYGLAFTIAMALGPFLASIIVDIGKFELLFLTATLLAFIGLTIVLFVRIPKVEKNKSFKISSLKSFIAPATYMYATITMLIMLPYGALLNFITIFCSKYIQGFSSVFFLSLAIGLTLSRIFAGKIFDKQGPFLLLIVSFLSVFVSIPILVYLNNPYFLALSAFVIGIGYGISFPVMQLMINRLMPVEKRGIANSIFLTALDVGIAGGTILMGFFSELLGLKISFLLFLIFPVLCLTIFMIKTKQNQFGNSNHINN